MGFTLPDSYFILVLLLRLDHNSHRQVGPPTISIKDGPPAHRRHAGRRHEQNHRYRSRDDQLGRGGHGRWRTGRDHQPGREPAHAVGRRLHEVRRAPRRAGRQASGHDESGEHHLLDQALHGTALRRSQRRDEDGAVPRELRRDQRRARARGRQAGRLRAARNFRDDPAEAEAGRRGLPRSAGQPRGHHGPRLLQRRAAPGHQGSRQDRRPRSDAHRQRADGRGAGLRARQEEGRDHRRLRLRRRHVRHLDPRSRRGRGRSQVDQR